MPSNSTQPHILCINRSPEILALLRLLLEEEGYRVWTQAGVEHNLDVVVDLDPDVIVIDYMWASSDNEWTYLTTLAMDPRTRRIPVLLCTGAMAQVQQMQAHLTSIGVRVLLNPFDIQALLDAVRELLAYQYPGAESPSDH